MMKNYEMSKEKRNSTQIDITQQEYEAILLGLSEMETTVTSGYLSESELEKYEYNISNLRNLIEKIKVNLIR